MGSEACILADVELSEVIARLRSEIEEMTDRRAQLSGDLERLKQEEEAALGQLKTLEEVGRKLDPNAEKPDRAKVPGRTLRHSPVWFLRSRQTAAFEALKDLGRPAHINELVGFLRERGRDDTYPLVSAALSALRSKGIVEPAGERGVWKLAVPRTVAHGLAADQVQEPRGGASG